MPRIEIPFNGPAYKDDVPFLNAQECINYFLESQAEGEKKKYILRGAPGLIEWCDTGYNGEPRGLIVMGNYLYAVIGEWVFRCDENATSTLLTNTLGTNSTPVGIEQNKQYVVIVDGNNGYYISTSSPTTLSSISGFPGGNTVTIQDGYFVVNRPNTALFYKSGLNDPTSWAALDFSSAGWKPDNAVAVFSAYRNVFIFGEETIEPWYNRGVSAGSGFPFARREGAEIEVGLAAANSISMINNALFFLGIDKNGQGQPYMSIGFQPKNIGNPAIVKQINSYSDISDAVGFSYQIDNHAFWEITFPTGNATWVYDSTEGEWSERQSWDRSTTPWALGRHRIQHHAFFKGKHLVQDIANGKIYELTRSAYNEDGTEMPAIRTTYAFNHNQDGITINELQILFTPGQGLISGQGSDPKSILRWSHNGGITWSNEVEMSLGDIGEYDNRAIWWQLGQGRNYALRSKTTDPINRDIWGAYADIEIDS